MKHVHGIVGYAVLAMFIIVGYSPAEALEGKDFSGQECSLITPGKDPKDPHESHGKCDSSAICDGKIVYDKRKSTIEPKPSATYYCRAGNKKESGDVEATPPPK
jgi:hypothetical protein